MLDAHNTALVKMEWAACSQHNYKQISYLPFLVKCILEGNSKESRVFILQWEYHFKKFTWIIQTNKAEGGRVGSATTLKDIMEEEHLFWGETEKEKMGCSKRKW